VWWQGVLYSHRSNYLHALVSLLPDCVPLSSSTVVMAVVPMFHANAWALVFTPLIAGAKLVLPGRRFCCGAPVAVGLVAVAWTRLCSLHFTARGIASYIDSSLK
jgi:hypothetical protein